VACEANDCNNFLSTEEPSSKRLTVSYDRKKKYGAAPEAQPRTLNVQFNAFSTKDIFLRDL